MNAIASPLVFSPNPTFMVGGWMACSLPAFGFHLFYCQQAYQVAYREAVTAVREEAIRQQWWEPSLN